MKYRATRQTSMWTVTLNRDRRMVLPPTAAEFTVGRKIYLKLMGEKLLCTITPVLVNGRYISTRVRRIGFPKFLDVPRPSYS